MSPEIPGKSIVPTKASGGCFDSLAARIEATTISVRTKKIPRFLIPCSPFKSDCHCNESHIDDHEFALPPAKQLPPNHSQAQPNDQVHQRQDESQLPPLP